MHQSSPRDQCHRKSLCFLLLQVQQDTGDKSLWPTINSAPPPNTFTSHPCQSCMSPASIQCIPSFRSYHSTAPSRRQRLTRNTRVRRRARATETTRRRLPPSLITSKAVGWGSDIRAIREGFSPRASHQAVARLPIHPKSPGFILPRLCQRSCMKFVGDAVAVNEGCEAGWTELDAGDGCFPRA